MESKHDAAMILCHTLGMSYENAMYKLNDVRSPQVIKPGHYFMDLRALNEIIRGSSIEKVK